jgi:hypothetical protein
MMSLPKTTKLFITEKLYIEREIGLTSANSAQASLPIKITHKF